MEEEVIVARNVPQIYLEVKVFIMSNLKFFPLSEKNHKHRWAFVWNEYNSHMMQMIWREFGLGEADIYKIENMRTSTHYNADNDTKEITITYPSLDIDIKITGKFEISDVFKNAIKEALATIGRADLEDLGDA